MKQIEMTSKQEFWQKHLIKQSKSGMTRRKYCEQENLKYDHMHYYASFFRRKVQGDSSEQSSFIKIPTPVQGVMTITLANGIKIDCPVDSEILSAVVKTSFASNQHFS